MARKVVTALNLTADLQAAGSSGTSGQVLTSSGSGAAPAWTSPPVYASNYVVGGKLAANQAITVASTDTLVSFVDNFDPNNWWDATTKRFTPTVAGYYSVSFNVLWSALNTTSQSNVQIRKNGTSETIQQRTPDANNPYFFAVSKIIYMNGTTDYLDFVVWSSVTTQSLQQGNSSGSGTNFSAALLTIPSKPRIKLVATTTKTIPTATVTTVNTWSQTDNTGGVFTLGSSQNVTVSKTGRYNLSVAMTWAANATGVRQVRILIDSVLFYAVMLQPGANLTFQQELVRTDISLSAGNALRVDVYQNSGGDLNVGAATYQQEWTMTYLGT